MSWEIRGKHRRYTRSYRRGGRVIRQYCGTGASAVLAASLDAQYRAERFRRAAERRAERANWAQAVSTVREVENRTNLLVSAVLLGSGYHKHGGQWRRSRNNG
jgi:hypothetical protein